MILVATRSISLRDGLLALLAVIAPDQTIELAGDIAEVITAATQSSFDLIVLDADLPTVSTGLVSGQIKQAAPAARLAILIGTVEGQTGVAPAQADAVLLKGMAAAEMAGAIEQLLTSRSDLS